MKNPADFAADFINRADLNSYTWKNRRRMAWGAFYSILIVTVLCFFYVDLNRLEKLETVITWFYMAMASIVGAYMGFATYASVAGRNGDALGYDGGYPEVGPDTDGSSVTPDVPEDEPIEPQPKRRKPKSHRRVPSPSIRIDVE